MDNLDVQSALDTRRNEDKNNKTKKTPKKPTLQTPPLPPQRIKTTTHKTKKDDPIKNTTAEPRCS